MSHMSQIYLDNVFHLPGHLPGVATPVWTCAANGLVGRQSSKKPIRVFLKRCRWLLNALIESASNVYWARLFHLLTSLSVKKLRLTSKLLLCLTSLNVCPLRFFTADNSNIDSRRIADQPLAILNTSMISALFRLSSKLQSPKRCSLSQYGGGPKISKVGHVTPFRPFLTWFCIFFVSAPGGRFAREIWSF